MKATTVPKPRRKGYHWTHSDSAKAKLRGNTNRRLRPFESLFNRLRAEAARQTKKWPDGKEFALSYEDFLPFTTQDCRYCHGSLVWEPFAINGVAQGGSNIDRKDSAKGYTKENSVACCAECNRRKSDYFSHEEFLLIWTIRRLKIEGDRLASCLQSLES